MGEFRKVNDLYYEESQGRSRNPLHVSMHKWEKSLENTGKLISDKVIMNTFDT